jgi:hypothetical protein
MSFSSGPRTDAQVVELKEPNAYGRFLTTGLHGRVEFEVSSNSHDIFASLLPSTTIRPLRKCPQVRRGLLDH